MRTALLTTVLLMATAMAWADEPTPPETKTETTAETKPPEQATAASSETPTAETATAATAKEDSTKRLRPPAGYKPRRVNGQQVWCAKLVVLGSKFPKEDCRNEAELRELIRVRESMRTDMEQRTRTCTSSGGCAMN
jgi:hypothetical protein